MKGAGPAGRVRPERATPREGNPSPEEGVWLILYPCTHLCNLGKKLAISSHLKPSSQLPTIYPLLHSSRLLFSQFLKPETSSACFRILWEGDFPVTLCLASFTPHRGCELYLCCIRHSSLVLDPVQHCHGPLFIFSLAFDGHLGCFDLGATENTLVLYLLSYNVHFCWAPNQEQLGQYNNTKYSISNLLCGRASNILPQVKHALDFRHHVAVVSVTWGS